MWETCSGGSWHCPHKHYSELCGHEVYVGSKFQGPVWVPGKLMTMTMWWWRCFLGRRSNPASNFKRRTDQALLLAPSSPIPPC